MIVKKPASLLTKIHRPRRGPLLTRPDCMPEDQWLVSGRFVYYGKLRSAVDAVRAYRPSQIPDDATPEFRLAYPVLFAALRGAAHRMRRALDEADWPTFRREADQFRLAELELRQAYALPLAETARGRTEAAKISGEQGADRRWGPIDRESRDKLIRAAKADGKSVKSIAEAFGISVSRVSQITKKI
jgi:hypothetical protein